MKFPLYNMEERETQAQTLKLCLLRYYVDIQEFSRINLIFYVLILKKDLGKHISADTL